VNGWHLLGQLLTFGLLAAGAGAFLAFTVERFQGCFTCGARAARYVRTERDKTAACEDHAGQLAELLVLQGRTVLVTPIRGRKS
jgi:hypothetical protein